MATIKKDFIETLKRRIESDPGALIDVITGLTGKGKKEGTSYRTACPLCGSQYGLTITPTKKIYKCFSCGNLSGKDPISFLMNAYNKNFTEAIEYIASHYNMLVEYNEEKKKTERKSGASNFCKRMLTQSGLSYSDITATVNEGDNDAVTTLRTFVSGTLTKDGEIDPSGDDAIIKYYNLEGQPVTFTTEINKKQVERRYLRVRYQYPDRHLDKNKRPIKYRSPMGAPTFIYYPEAIRKAYKTSEELHTLFIQEGEKKAEKACKHGIMSVAVSGIQNIGSKGTLPDDIIALVEKCKVKEVVFMLDSDCYDLSHTLTVTDPIEKRPSNFFYAVRNFKDYFAKLKNHNIYVELYFGHIRKEATSDKGTDDLLTNTLAGHEGDLLTDITTAKNEKSGTGKWVQLHKITTFPDSKIMEFWKLQSPHDFCKRYIDQLRDLPEFTFRGRRWKFNEKDELENAQPLEEDEMFWTVQKRKDKAEYYFCYVGAKKFLERRGFWRWKKPDGDYEFVRVDDSIVHVVKHHEIADFIKQWTQDTLSKPVLEMLLKGGAQYLGPVSLSMLDYLQEPFEKPQRGIQRMYFANEIWEVTAEGVKPMKYSQQRTNIWRHQKKDHTVTLLPDLIHINRLDDDTWTYQITAEGAKCDFLRFLENASNFTWRKDASEVTQEERKANAQHLVSKLAAFGYLVSSAKVASFSRAVIAMDGKQAEIGRSDGRTGKSLLGKAVGCMTQAKYYNGKAFASQNNQFIWDGVDNRTRLVLIDDCQRDFDFEDLFGLISGDWPVNPKGAKPYTIPYSESPKVYITTNHAVTGDGASYTDRQWMLAFSDFYNAEHKPEHDFSSYFFEGWDGEQWDLFYNLVAKSLQIFFKYGYIATPGERLEKRKLLQEIGDEFKLWADEYYAPAERPEDRDKCHLNAKLTRKEIYDDFLNTVGSSRSKFYTPKAFKNRLKKYCELENLIFNPGRYDPVRKRYLETDADGRPKMDDKSNGTEWITIGNLDYYAMGTTQPIFGDTAIPLPDDPPFDIILDTPLTGLDILES